jgi:uncharacterized protein YbjT (DUF2867 family)
MKIKVIITGVTGMVGEGVLHECLSHPDVEKVLVVNRKPCRVTDPKLVEIIHQDFFDITPVEGQLKNYDACFFCLGVSSVGMQKTEYYKLTYTLTMHFAGRLAELNPQMTFCYISGAGTDSSEKGRTSWARVKGKTENDLMKLPFSKVYAFRPGLLHPAKGMKNVQAGYKYIGFMYPFLRAVMPNFISTLSELGLAMINSVMKGYEKPVLEVKEILDLAKR